MSYKESVNITAVERALKVMETIYRNDREMGIKEIAVSMDEHQSTIYRVVSTLVASGYLYQNEQSSKYGLGYKPYLLGRHVEKQSALIQAVKPYADKVADEFGETVNVAIRDRSKKDGYYAITIYQARGNNRTLGVSEAIGRSYECYTNSIGKVLMAYSDDLDFDLLRKIDLIKYTEYTITEYSDFVHELENIRRNGYGIDNQEREIGLFCVSCPVLDFEGNAVAALSVSGFENSVKSHGVENIIRSLKDACTNLGKLVI